VQVQPLNYENIFKSAREPLMREANSFFKKNILLENKKIDGSE
jgi:hypothetical protein